MHRLAKLGFTQSYTYFTWRNTKAELIEYFTELVAERRRASTSGPTAGRTRPTSCTSTCRTAAGRRSSLRLVLAATLAGQLRHLRPGLSSCCENAPREPGSEEYLDSEKYEIQPLGPRRAPTASRR